MRRPARQRRARRCPRRGRGGGHGGLARGALPRGAGSGSGGLLVRGLLVRGLLAGGVRGSGSRGGRVDAGVVRLGDRGRGCGGARAAGAAGDRRLLLVVRGPGVVVLVQGVALRFGGGGRAARLGGEGSGERGRAAGPRRRGRVGAAAREPLEEAGSPPAGVLVSLHHLWCTPQPVGTAAPYPVALRVDPRVRGSPSILVCDVRPEASVVRTGTELAIRRRTCLAARVCPGKDSSWRSCRAAVRPACQYRTPTPTWPSGSALPRLP